MSKFKKIAVLGVGVGVVIAGLGAAHAFGGLGGKGWGRGHGQGMQRMLYRFDANDDGEITLEEIETKRGERFAKFDANNDGTVEETEIKERMLAKIEARINRRVAKMMRRLDADRDGRITPQEFNRHARERFSWNDLNDDGKLAGDELPGRRRGHRR